jgi:hypothetical protein
MERIERKFCEVRLDDTNTKTGTFSGYGAVFGNEDSYGDVIEKGAFASSLQEWKSAGKYPPMLLQHGGSLRDDLVPVGKWTSMMENARGLKVEGKLFGLDTDRGKYLYEGLKEGVLDGLSIGFRTRQYRMGTKPSEPERTLTDIDLVELSIVTFPANPKARISSVKSFTLDQWRDFEMSLRDAGLSRKDAETAVSHFKKAFGQGDPGNLDTRLLRDAASPEDAALEDVLKSADALVQDFIKGCIHV